MDMGQTGIRSLIYGHTLIVFEGLDGVNWQLTNEQNFNWQLTFALDFTDNWRKTWLSLIFYKNRLKGLRLASSQTSFGVRLSRIHHECVTNEPQRTSAGRLALDSIVPFFSSDNVFRGYGFSWSFLRSSSQYYTCQLFLSQMREIFTSWPRSPETSRRLPNVAKNVRRCSEDVWAIPKLLKGLQF